MTKQQMRDRVASKIGLSGTAEFALIEGWVDESVEQYLADTKALVREAVMTMTAGVSDYTLPMASVLSFSKIWIVPAVGDSMELKQISSSEMLQKRRYVYSGDHPRVYELLGMDLLRVYPTPDGTENLHLLYVPAPATLALSDDLTIVGVPLPDHPTCEQYVSWKAADWDDDTSSKIGETYQQGWEAGLHKARMRRNRMDNGWGPARPGRSSVYVPPRNGFDTGV